MSENPPHRVGKIFSNQSYIGKSTTYAPGREDWNLKKISHTHSNFNVSHFSIIFNLFFIVILTLASEERKLQIKKL